MKKTRFFSAFAALVLCSASLSALPTYADDEDVLYGDIRYSKVLNTELGIYAGDSLDFSKVILEAVQYNWEGTASYVYSFTVGSGEFADLYTLDTTQVDTNTPGDYEVIIRPATGETGSFPYRAISPVQYYDVCMKGTESVIPVKVYPNDYNANTPLYLRCYTEYIEMYRDGGVMIPLIGAYPAKVEYEIADETIAKVQASSTAQSLTLLGLKEGETTVTVRASDGRTTTEKVRVLPAQVIETAPPVYTTTAILNPELTATTTTETVTTIDPATTTTKWWYQFETTEPVSQTSTAVTTANPNAGTATTTTTTAEKEEIYFKYLNSEKGYCACQVDEIVGLYLANYDDSLYEIGETPIDFKIEDENVAMISQVQGSAINIKGVSVGETVLIAKTPDGQSASVKIIVEEAVVTTTTTASLSEEVFLGDATCDNSVDVCDAVLIARFLAEDSEAIITDQGRRNADYNADGDITQDDVMLILKKIARLI